MRKYIVQRLSCLQAFTACLFLLAGCAHYERRPLTLHRCAEDRMAQAFHAEPFRDFAERLDDAGQVEAFDPKDGLGPAEAEVVALPLNPQLRLAPAQAQVPLAGAREAGWWPDPELPTQVLRYPERGRKMRCRLEILRRYPDLTTGPDCSLAEGFSSLGFGFGFPIPLWNRKRQAIAQASKSATCCMTRGVPDRCELGQLRVFRWESVK
jgi:hypothetical protein